MWPVAFRVVWCELLLVRELRSWMPEHLHLYQVSWVHCYREATSFRSINVNMWVILSVPFSSLYFSCFTVHTFEPEVSLFSLYTPQSLHFSLSPLSACHPLSLFPLPPTEQGLFLPRMPLFCSSAHFLSTGCRFRVHSAAAHIRLHSQKHKHTHVDTQQNGGSPCSWGLTRRREGWRAEGGQKGREE